jgi:hypothetical protein
MLNRCFAAFAVAVALMLAVSSTARAADDKADFTGTWKWSAQMRNNTVEFTAKLKQDGDKVTGTVAGGGGGGGNAAQPAEIKDGKVTDGELSFSVVRTRGGNTLTTTYTGKLDGADTIKGKIEATGGQTTRPARDWTATRAKEGAAGGDGGDAAK